MENMRGVFRVSVNRMIHPGGTEIFSMFAIVAMILFTMRYDPKSEIPRNEGAKSPVMN